MVRIICKLCHLSLCLRAVQEAKHSGNFTQLQSALPVPASAVWPGADGVQLKNITEINRNSIQTDEKSVMKQDLQ